MSTTSRSDSPTEDSTKPYNAQTATISTNHQIVIMFNQSNMPDHPTTSMSKISNHTTSTPDVSNMSATPSLATIPLRFASQLREMQDNQCRLESRINTLTNENAALTARVAELESANAALSSRRREVVTQFTQLQTLHQEAANTFHMRSQDIGAEDVEGILGVWAGSVNLSLNHHQRILGRVVQGGGLQIEQTGGLGLTVGYRQGYSVQGGMQGYVQASPVHQVSGQVEWQYPATYTEQAYCRAHRLPYSCRMCGT